MILRCVVTILLAAVVAGCMPRRDPPPAPWRPRATPDAWQELRSLNPWVAACPMGMALFEDGTPPRA